MALIVDPDNLSQGGASAVSDLVLQNQSVAQIEFQSTSAALPTVSVGDYIELRDHSVSSNNGLYEVISITTANTLLVVEKMDTLGTVVNPSNSASEAATVLGSSTDEKNVYVDVDNETIQLINGAGALSDDGVTGVALYSFLKEEWKNDALLVKFEFPMVAITPEQFEWTQGWEPADFSEGSTVATANDSNTRELLRTCGWSEVTAGGDIKRTYLGFISLGNIDSTDKRTGDRPYYFFASDSAATSTVFAGPANEAVQIFGSTANGGNIDLDVTNEELTVRIRVFGKTYGQSTTTAIGASTPLSNLVYRFPLSEAPDNVIQDLANTETGGNIGTLLTNINGTPVAPYDDMTIGYFASAQDRSGFNALGGDTPSPGDAQFGVIVDGDVSVLTEDGGGAASAEQVYAFVQAQLQSTGDINDGSGAAAVTVVGQLAEPLLAIASTGNTLFSLAQTTNPGGDGTGVYVDSFSSNDINRVSFRDNDGDARTFPFQASFSLQFNNNLQGDADAIYRVFFTSVPSGDFGTRDAILVEDAAGVDIAGDIAGASTVSATFDYDGNTQGGRSSGTDASITIVAIGLTTAQYVIATGSIVRANNQSFSLVAALERNFNNPV